MYLVTDEQVWWVKPSQQPNTQTSSCSFTSPVGQGENRRKARPLKSIEFVQSTAWGLSVTMVADNRRMFCCVVEKQSQLRLSHHCTCPVSYEVHPPFVSVVPSMALFIQLSPWVTTGSITMSTPCPFGPGYSVSTAKTSTHCTCTSMNSPWAAVLLRVYLLQYGLFHGPESFQGCSCSSSYLTSCMSGTAVQVWQQFQGHMTSHMGTYCYQKNTKHD